MSIEIFHEKGRAILKDIREGLNISQLQMLLKSENDTILRLKKQVIDINYTINHKNKYILELEEKLKKIQSKPRYDDAFLQNLRKENESFKKKECLVLFNNFIPDICPIKIYNIPGTNIEFSYVQFAGSKVILNKSLNKLIIERAEEQILKRRDFLLKNSSYLKYLNRKTSYKEDMYLSLYKEFDIYFNVGYNKNGKFLIKESKVYGSSTRSTPVYPNHPKFYKFYFPKEKESNEIKNIKLLIKSKEKTNKSLGKELLKQYVLSKIQ